MKLASATLRAPVGVCGLIMALLTPSEAIAQVGMGAAALLEYSGWIEPVVPDLRGEYDSGAFLTLSWPVHLDANRLVGRRAAWDDVIVPSLFLEPQWRPSGGQLRVAGGSRLLFPFSHGTGAFSLIVDLAGVSGTDGHGVLVGGGPAVRGSQGRNWVGLIYRHCFTTEGSRDDLSLDVLFPFF